MTDEPTHLDELARRRWAKEHGCATDHPALDAVKAFLDDAIAGKIDVKHVIVVYASEPESNDKLDGVGFFQAGCYHSVSQIGLVEYAKGSLLQHLLDER